MSMISSVQRGSSLLSTATHHRGPLQLLEINVISAQDLFVVSRNMKTYAIAWVHPNRKLSTRVDSKNGNNPSWNDKFVFRVNESFLRSDTAAVMIEIYAVKWFRDVRVGSVRVLVGNLLPPVNRIQSLNSGMRFVALQVRRPSGRPQGILNIGVTLLDGSMRSMPLYTQLSASALGFRDLMGEEPQHPDHHPHILRRAKSARPSSVTADDFPRKSEFTYPIPEDGEPPIITITTTGSMWSESDVGPTPSSLAVGATAHDLFSLPDVDRSDLVNEWHPEKTRVEPLKSKLERWKTELPAVPVLDRRLQPIKQNKSKAGHRRRHTEGNVGLFSCLGSAYGFECSVSCGVPRNAKGRDGLLSDSDDTMPFPKRR